VLHLIAWSLTLPSRIPVEPIGSAYMLASSAMLHPFGQASLTPCAKRRRIHEPVGRRQEVVEDQHLHARRSFLSVCGFRCPPPEPSA